MRSFPNKQLVQKKKKKKNQLPLLITPLPVVVEEEDFGQDL